MAGNKRVFLMALRNPQQHRKAELLAARRSIRTKRVVSVASLYEAAMKAYLRTALPDYTEAELKQPGPQWEVNAQFARGRGRRA